MPSRTSLPWAIAAGLLVVLLAMLAAPAAAAPLGVEHCVSLQKGRGVEALVNSCGTCQEVEVERRRPGMEKPTHHTYTVTRGVPLQLSFRGPGDTVVQSQKACDAPVAAQAAGDGQACVSLQRTAKDGMVLLNSCGVCRLAVLERVGLAKGDPNGQRPYTIAAKSYLPVRSEGATGARIFNDAPCPNR